MATLFFYFAKFTKHIMRGIVAQLVEHWSIYCTRGVDGSNPFYFSFIFLERRVHMSIEQLELILSDTYQMDVSFPMIFGHRKEFMQSSYSIWSVNELLEYVSSELYPKDNASIAEIEEIVRCFKTMMSKYYHMRQDTQLMFSIAINLADNVLDILQAME